MYSASGPGARRRIWRARRGGGLPARLSLRSYSSQSASETSASHIAACASTHRRAHSQQRCSLGYNTTMCNDLPHLGAAISYSTLARPPRDNQKLPDACLTINALTRLSHPEQNFASVHLSHSAEPAFPFKFKFWQGNGREKTGTNRQSSSCQSQIHTGDSHDLQNKPSVGRRTRKRARRTSAP